jgi:phosphatidylglycerophosphate synthase
VNRVINKHLAISSAKDFGLIALTGSRLFFAFPLIYGIVYDRRLALLALVMTVAADVVDGALARRLDLDTPRRRVMDAGVDMALIHSAAIAGVIVEPSMLPLYVPFALRDLGLVAGDWWCISHYDTHIGGGSLHRASSLSIACLAVTALTTSSPVAISLAAVVAVLVSYSFLPSYIRALKRVRVEAPSGELRVVLTDKVFSVGRHSFND